MRSLNFLIKPASSLCNMRCRYCFYEDEASNRSQKDYGIMTPETSERLIDEAFAAVNARGSISFMFQGGEPTLAGLDYFRHFTDTVKKANTKNINVQYAIQTNGLTIDREWADFLKERHFLTGISLDGDKALHDSQRPDTAGKGTWNRVIKSVDLLKKAGVELNLLCVVTRSCAKSAVKIYNALKKTGIGYLQFIPCLDPLETERGSMPWSLLPEDYGKFLCDLFDAWYIDFVNGQYISIRLFDDYIHLAMGMPPGTCSVSGSCGAYYTFEADGSLYPCDFYVLDEWRMGNINEHSLPELTECGTQRRFLEEGDNHPAACDRCEWRKMCFGGCKRDWFINPESGEKENYYCRAFREFFSYAMPRMQKIAGVMKM